MFIILFLALIIVALVGMYKTFSRMGYTDAWWMFIPILNIIFMLKVAEKPVWWLVLFFIPVVGSLLGIYIGWLVSEKVAKAYGQSTGFAIGLLLLGFIFYPILGFGSKEPALAA